MREGTIGAIWKDERVLNILSSYSITPRGNIVRQQLTESILI